MAKKKRTEAPSEDTLAAVVELAVVSGFDVEILDDCIRDAADLEADMIYDNAKSESLSAQLEFLHMHGYAISRLRQIVEKKSDDPFAE